MEVQKISLSEVHPSPMNPRKTFDEDGIRELAENIEAQGLLQPITVRPKGDGYEIVCGERRYRAVRRLSEKWKAMDSVAPKGHSYDRFSEIIAIVREMTDEEAFEAMVTENLQRRDVDPMEEAFAISQLLGHGKEPAEIAARIGKSVRFVQDRLRLNSLVPEAATEVREGRMPITTAMLICKLSAEGQRTFLKQSEGFQDGLSRKAAERFVYNRFMLLDKVMWPDGYDGGCGRACRECHLNTANSGCLFWEMRACEDGGKCTSPDSFRNKTAAWMIEQLERLAPVLVRKGEPMEYGRW